MKVAHRRVIAESWSRFAAASAVAGTFIGIVSDMKNFLPVWMVGASIAAGGLITVIFYYIEKRHRRNPKIWLQAQQVRGRLEELQMRGWEIERGESYYRLLFFVWRLEVELKKTESINGGVISLPAISAFDYMTFVFSNIMRGLSEGDEYVTTSCVEFWHRVKQGDGAFLDQNMKAALQGVVVNRVILVDARAFDESHQQQEYKKKLEGVVRYFYEKQKAHPEEFELMNHFFVLSEEYEEEAKSPVPYAIVTNPDLKEYMAILPSLQSQPNESLMKIEFGRYRDVATEAHYLKFQEFFHQRHSKYTIDKMYQMLFEQ